MAKKDSFVPNALRPWIEARKRFRLTDAQVQMARELGLNPNKLGKIANHRQEPWKVPLPVFIEHLYVKRFGKQRPDITGSIEETAAARRIEKAARKEARSIRKAAAASGLPPQPIEAPANDLDDGILDGTAIDRLDSESPGPIGATGKDAATGAPGGAAIEPLGGVTQAMTRQSPPVMWEDLTNSFEYVSSGQPFERQAVLNRETGEFIWYSEHGDSFDEWPDDVDDGEKYVSIPHKRELDLGRSLVMDFVRRFLPDDLDDVHRIFGRRGAYSRFKDFLERRNVLEEWHEFENNATERALREWCEENGVVIAPAAGAAGDARG